LGPDLSPEPAERGVCGVGPDQVLAMGAAAEPQDVLEGGPGEGVDDVERLLLEQLARLHVERLMAEEAVGRDRVGDVAVSRRDGPGEDMDLVAAGDQSPRE